jgi:hypothetical protein
VRELALRKGTLEIGLEDLTGWLSPPLPGTLPSLRTSCWPEQGKTLGP